MGDYSSFLSFIGDKKWRYPQYLCDSSEALSMIAFCRDGIVKKTVGQILNGKIISQNVERFPSSLLKIIYDTSSLNKYTFNIGGLSFFSHQMVI